MTEKYYYISALFIICIISSHAGVPEPLVGVQPGDSFTFEVIESSWYSDDGGRESFSDQYYGFEVDLNVGDIFTISIDGTDSTE